MQNRDGPYHGQALPVCYGVLLFLGIEGSGPVASAAISSVLLFLEKYRPDALVTSIDIKYVPPFCFRLSQDWGAYQGLSQ